MENKRIIVTGDKGYLASSIIQTLNKHNEIVSYGGDVRIYRQHENIDVIIHFASPSDIYDFTDRERTVTTIVDGTINMLKVATDCSAKLIYASTMGVYSTVMSNNCYSACKLAMEHYIKSIYNNYIILRIPRVYSKCRRKGLMRQIRENIIPEKDMDKIIEFITLDDFITQTLPVLSKRNVTHEYDITQEQSIREVKQWINE